mgnify:FL=1
MFFTRTRWTPRRIGAGVYGIVYALRRTPVVGRYAANKHDPAEDLLADPADVANLPDDVADVAVKLEAMTNIRSIREAFYLALQVGDANLSALWLEVFAVRVTTLTPATARTVPLLLSCADKLFSNVRQWQTFCSVCTSLHIGQVIAASGA